MSSLFKPSISPEAARKMLLRDFPLLEMEVDNFLREIGNEVLAFPSLEIQKLFAGVVFELVSNTATPLSDRKELRLSQLEAYLDLKSPVPTMTPARRGAPYAG